MKRIIGILISIFLVIGVPGLAAAQDTGTTGLRFLRRLNCTTDQIPRFNGTHWICSEDREGSPALIVRDSLGNALGSFAGIEEGIAVVAIEVDGQQFALLFDGSEYLVELVYFESFNCTGTAYADLGTVALFKRALVAGLGHLLYVEDGPPVSINVQSFLDENGNCVPISSSTTMSPMTFVEDLDASFTPPFSVQ